MRGLFLLLSLVLPLAACRREAQAPVDPSPRGAPPASARLEVTEISFAGPGGHRKDASFLPGERVTCLLTTRGYAHQGGRVEIVGDVTVTGPHGQTVLSLQSLELVKGPAPTPRPGSLRLAAELRISAAAPPGAYEVAIELRDLLGGRRGVGRAGFRFLGTPEPPSPHLALSRLRWAAGHEAFPGAVLPLAFTLKGLRTQKVAGKGHRLAALAELAILDAAGNVVAPPRREALLRGELGFAPEAVPLELQADVPRTASPGTYRLRVRVEDGLSGSKTDGTLPLTVLDGNELKLWSLHLHDASGLPRDHFRLGAQAFLRFALRGLRPRGTSVEAEVDLAVAGPEGVYFAQKRAAEARGASGQAAAAAGRFPAQIPLILPTLAPAGRYRVVLRARDLVAGRECTAELPFAIEGSAPSPLGRFAIAELDVRDRPDLPPQPGDTFVAGRSYQLTPLVGGVRPRTRRPLIFPLNLEGDLRLRDLAGRVVHERKRLFQLRRELAFRPLRVPVPATWMVPATLRGGLYDLELEIHDRDDDHVSQLRRRVEVVEAVR